MNTNDDANPTGKNRNSIPLWRRALLYTCLILFLFFPLYIFVIGADMMAIDWIMLIVFFAGLLWASANNKIFFAFAWVFIISAIWNHL